MYKNLQYSLSYTIKWNLSDFNNFEKLEKLINLFHELFHERLRENLAKFQIFGEKLDSKVR